MRVEVIPAQQLTPALRARWIEIQQREPMFRNPFVRPEFTMAVASVRSDVEVAILEHAGEVAGFFPFQRSRWNTGKPVGSRVSDLQVVVAAPGTPWNATELVRACRLKSWCFHLLPADQTQFLPHATERTEAVYVDLSDGYEAYANERRLAGTDKLKNLEKLWRQAERRVGPLRYEQHTDDTTAFETLLRWKSAQYQRTGAIDVLSFAWVAALLRVLLVKPTAEFGGVMSVLYIGDRLAAVDLALRSQEVRCEWFGSYELELARYSPGSLALMAAAKAGSFMGVTRIELGKNNLPYKSSFSSASYPVASGAVTVGAAAKFLQGATQTVRRWCHSRYLVGPARIAKWMAKPVRGRRLFK